jgi:hypothetical protein
MFGIKPIEFKRFRPKTAKLPKRNHSWGMTRNTPEMELNPNALHHIQLMKTTNENYSRHNLTSNHKILIFPFIVPCKPTTTKRKIKHSHIINTLSKIFFIPIQSLIITFFRDTLDHIEVTR